MKFSILNVKLKKFISGKIEIFNKIEIIIDKKNKNKVEDKLVNINIDKAYLIIMNIIKFYIFTHYFDK